MSGRRSSTGENDTLVLASADVEALLPMADCIPLMQEALAEMARGQVEVPVRMVLHAGPGAGDVALMPAELRASGVLGFKAVTVFPGARARGEATHQAVVALLDRETGRLLALVDGTSVTTIRTAAVSAVATRHLARPEARVLAVLGGGVQAAAHLRSIPLVREIDEIRIWARRPDQAAALAGGAGVFAPRVGTCATAHEAVDGADIVVTATTATTPVIERSWLAPGCHVNAVGSCVPHAREIDGPTVAAARVIVDDRRAAMAEAGDLLLAIADGAFAAEGIAGELGDVIEGRVAGRTSDEEITLFESLGLGIEDVAAAGLVYGAPGNDAQERPSGSDNRLVRVTLSVAAGAPAA